jgi:hypothetical protein
MRATPDTAWSLGLPEAGGFRVVSGRTLAEAEDTFERWLASPHAGAGAGVETTLTLGAPAPSGGPLG